MWGPVQFIINDDPEKFCFSHFHNSVPSNKSIFYGPGYTFWREKHKIGFINIKGKLICFNPCIYIVNFFIDLGYDII